MDRHEIERSSSREKHNKLYTFPLNKGAVYETFSTEKVTFGAIDKAHTDVNCRIINYKKYPRNI
tara:strand:- start:344 stop:535 length:192 start_codon:yes stop_codon:yes gene_type:complete